MPNYYKMSIRQSTMLMILIIGFVGPTQSTDVYCTDKDFVRLESPTGKIIIPNSVKRCVVKTKDKTKLLAIKTDDPSLKKLESIEITSTPDHSKRYNPPFYADWIINGYVEPELVFKITPSDNVTASDNTTISIDYLQDLDIPFEADVIDHMILKPSGVSQINLAVSKTTNKTIHLDIDSEHILLNKDNLTKTIKFVNDNNVVIKSSVALESCSGYFNDEILHAIQGPTTKDIENYECVNIFEEKKSGHYDVDFKDFLGLVDEEDELIIGNTLIRSPQDEDFKNKLVSFKNNKLVVIYKSPKTIKPKGFQFQLTVAYTEFGGIVENEGVLNFGNKDHIHFVLKPAIGQYASIKMPANFRIKDFTMKITNNKRVIELTNNAKLPEILALDEPDTDMILDFTGKGLENLDKKINFKSITKNCHKMIQEPGDVASISGPIAEPCYWMVASSNNFDIKFNLNDLNPDGCLEIVSQEEEKPIYKKCALNQNEVLPTFILKQAYIKLTLPKANTRVITSFSLSSSQKLINLSPDEKELTIASQDYPVSYPWSGEAQSYSLTGINKNYIFSVSDVDLRKGEKLTLDKDELNTNSMITGDLIRSKVNTTMTLTKSTKTDDFDLHRGFKIIARQFAEVMEANITENQLVTSGNTSDLFIKISAPATKNGLFSSRLSYNVTFKTVDKEAAISIYDGRTILKHKIESAKLVGESTSDTLLFVYRNEKGKLPIATINYQTISCNSTSDHVCDLFTRCVPKNLICQSPRKFYCDDGSDVNIQCKGSEPIPQPKTIETGLSGIAVFILCMLMLAFGAVGAIYGPDLYKYLENRFRSGQYSSFNSINSVE